MPNLSPELQHLDEFIQWTVNQENYISMLNQTTLTTPELVKKFELWSEQFARLREKAESQKKAGPYSKKMPAVLSYLSQQANQLYMQFTHFIRENMGDWGFQHINGQMEESWSDPPYPGVPLQPVPIGEHVLPPLPYSYNALEPYIDEQTMHLHHDIHHKSYVDGLNKAEKEMKKARETGDYSLIKHWEREAAFNGAGHYLHTIFWNNMKPGGGGTPKGALARELEKTFGSFEKFREHFSHAAEKVEGGGWAILIWSPRSHRVEILQAEKHQNLSQQDAVPLLVLDVWEHAYYLKYQTKRKDYIAAWWNVVNWHDVNLRFQQAQKLRWQPY